jgi:hypothetical protein
MEPDDMIKEDWKYGKMERWTQGDGSRIRGKGAPVMRKIKVLIYTGVFSKLGN